MADKIQQRRDTKARWTQFNPVLLEGEPGYELDTDQYKIGDGVHTWNDLAYRGDPCLNEVGTSTTTPVSQKTTTDLVSEYNISKFHTNNVADDPNFGTDTFTLEQAISAVPASLRTPGLKGTFKSSVSNQWETWGWNGVNYTYLENWAQLVSMGEIGKRKVGIFSPEASQILPNFDAILDIWFEEGSSIPEYDIYLWFLQQPPSDREITFPTIYINRDDGTGKALENGSEGVLVKFTLPDKTEGTKELIEMSSASYTPSIDSTDGLKLKALVDWSRANDFVWKTSGYARLNINSIKESTERRKKIASIEKTALAANACKKTNFPFLADDANFNSLTGFGLYGIEADRELPSNYERIGIGYIGQQNEKGVETVYFYIIKNGKAISDNIISQFLIPVSEITPGIKCCALKPIQGNEVVFTAYIDLESLKKPLRVIDDCYLNISGFFVPSFIDNRSSFFKNRNILNNNANINSFDTSAILDVKLLEDRDNYLEKNPVYLWSLGNYYIEESNKVRCYIYIINKEYKEFKDIICLYEKFKEGSSTLFSNVEKCVLSDKENLGLKFEVTVDWNKCRTKILDFKTKFIINPNIGFSVFDPAKQTYFVRDYSKLEALPDGFILRMSKSKDTFLNLGLWYIVNKEERRVYVCTLDSSGIPIGDDGSIFAMFVKSGYSNAIEDIELLPYKSNPNNVSFKMKVDWSKIPKGFASSDFNLKLNLNNIPTVEQISTNEENFSIQDNIPIIPKQLFLRSDKTIPVYKNSLFTNILNLEKIDVNLMTTVGNQRKSISILEPTHFGGEDGIKISKKSRLYFQRTSNYDKLFFKDIEILKRDVSELNGKTVSVLSLGDSITEGLSWKDIPVCMLSDELKKVGVTTIFIGTLGKYLNNKQGQEVKLNFEGRGGWRYRTITGLESKFAGLNVVIPEDPNKHEWIVGVDGPDMNSIKKNNSFLYPATSTDKTNYPNFCYHFVVGNTGYNQSYSENPNLGDYVIFDPIRYFSERSVDIPDILTIAFGTNEWYLGNVDLPEAVKAAKFMIQQFRRASLSMKIVIIPAKTLNMRRQQYWEETDSKLCSYVMKICEELIELGDNNLYICPIYAQCNRYLAYDDFLDTPADITSMNTVKSATISQDVHSLYVDDDSNDEYADSLTACVLNIIP